MYLCCSSTAVQLLSLLLLWAVELLHLRLLQLPKLLLLQLLPLLKVQILCYCYYYCNYYCSVYIQYCTAIIASITTTTNTFTAATISAHQSLKWNASKSPTKTCVITFKTKTSIMKLLTQSSGSKVGSVLRPDCSLLVYNHATFCPQSGFEPDKVSYMNHSKQTAGRVYFLPHFLAATRSRIRH